MTFPSTGLTRTYKKGKKPKKSWVRISINIKKGKS